MAIHARAEWMRGFESRLDDGRGHVVTVDLPPGEGGTDAGTSALELMILSLAGCISTIFGIVATKRKLPYDGLSVSLTALRPSGSATIQKVEGRVEVQSAAAREEIETAVRLTLRTCPVGVLLERAHIPVDLTVIVASPSTAPKHRHGLGHVSPEPS